VRTDLTEYATVAEATLEQLAQNETAMAVIGIGAAHGLTIVQTFSALGGLLNPELDIHAPPISGVGEARQVLEALDSLRGELLSMAIWNKAGLQLLLNSLPGHDLLLASKALIGSVGLSGMSSVPLADLLFVLGPQRSTRWVEQASRATQSVALIG
jgi:hypothetical protein